MTSERAPGAGLCDGDTTALVLDGANGICGRQPATLARATSLVAALTFAAVWMFAPVRWRRRAVLLGCGLSIPGLVALAFLRGDAPAKVVAASAPIVRLEDAVRRHANAYGCAVVERNDCEACQPVLRLALAHAGPCESKATIVVAANALGGECTAAGSRLTCSGRP